MASGGRSSDGNSLGRQGSLRAAMLFPRQAEGCGTAAVGWASAPATLRETVMWNFGDHRMSLGRVPGIQQGRFLLQRFQFVM